MRSLLLCAPLLLLTLPAEAQPLRFSSLSLSADDGVSLQYSLSSESWSQVESLVRMGSGPVIVVQYHKPGHDQTSHVELLEMSRSVSLASGSWPTGMTAEITLSGSLGGFDSLAWPGGSGTTLRVPISGGQDGSASGSTGSFSSTSSSSTSGSWSTSSSDPAPRPGHAHESAGSVEAMERLLELAEQERARQEREQAEAILQAQFEAAMQKEAEIRAIIADPSHPTSAACGQTFGDEGRYEKCVRRALARYYGPDEVLACGRLDTVGYKFECVESLEDRRHVGTATIHTCIDTFGSGREGIKCIWRTQEARLDPSADVRACGLAFSDYSFASSCISRYAEVAWEPSAVLHACVSGFEGEDQLVCAKLAGAAGHPPADRIIACTQAFSDTEERLECVHITAHAGSDVAPAIPVCAELFESRGKRYDCLELLRSARDRDPERLRGCAVETSDRRRMRCVEGP